MRAFILAVVLSTGAAAAEPVAPFTVSDARSLSTSQLATELVGYRMASRIIQARRHEYNGSSASIPEYVEFFTQPELSQPVINGICRTDVITIEYDWFDNDAATASTPMKIARIAAQSRYKSFPEPAGDPGSDDHTRAQTAACAAMKSAVDAFRAPSGGDAQWLVAIHREYSNPSSQFAFTCKELAGRTCGLARRSLQGLALNMATDVRLIDCPSAKTGDQVDYCYRLTFPYSAEREFPEIGDYPEMGNPEWIMTVSAGMRNGMAPVKIRSLHLEHVSRPFVMH